MPRRFIFLPFAIALLFCASVARLPADSPGRYVVASPDHPRTFEVGANDKLSQDLKWDGASRQLLLTVVYAMDPSSDRWLMSDQKAYTLHFPNVRCDEQTRTLYVTSKSQGRIVVGSLDNGLTGPAVRLRDNVELVAHRHDMHLDAQLVVH
jgi:hypothetical protein